MSYSSIEMAVASIARGEMVLVVDDEHRENEGDLIMAAEKVTAEHIAFMVRYTSGVICLPMTGERLDELGLPLMVLENTDSHQTAFTVSIDYAIGTTTGISAADRTATIRAAVDRSNTAADFHRPGHVFPLRYKSGGVLVRPGHTEAAVDLATLAGMAPAGVLCEVVNDDGTMAKGDRLFVFAKTHAIPVITIADLVAYRWKTEALVSREAEATIPTEYGEFLAIGYRALDTRSEHMALVLGDVAGKDGVLTRVHSVCLTGDVFGSRRCDCGAQLRESMRRIADEGQGIIVYNPTHEGRGIGLVEKLAAYRLQEDGLDTVEANQQIGHPPDQRHYGVDAQILLDLKVASIRLLTNNPEKLDQLAAFGITISERVPLWVGENHHNKSYLETKESKLGHLGSTG
ncbi:MAG: bifunctional 3,4-dihydroxy-2-butanone-4-phosphate synthase/GTP cyclohydrolase II [Acidobacteria bacterium]|nr:bifunctional 3,4-dihydroxy-2-butanone-4-phosphate synthase/GTP cyclohydrolase II [Acidobacteriota bacterium]MCH8993210.1 bifunctional 3,4-dihydroxy-2-butanone-4-phosphate synthase/GTP cyclohydrolase II [Acidobacteriota bacterium]